MEMNPYIPIYDYQVGTGISGFQGTRDQRGHGFFGKLFSGITSFIKNIAPSLGKKALPSALGLAQDIMAGENVAKSAKTRLKEAGKNIANETLDQLKTKFQGGQGISRKKNKRKAFFELYNTIPIEKKKRKVNKRHKKKRKRNKK